MANVSSLARRFSDDLAKVVVDLAAIVEVEPHRTHVRDALLFGFLRGQLTIVRQIETDLRRATAQGFLNGGALIYWCEVLAQVEVIHLASRAEDEVLKCNLAEAHQSCRELAVAILRRRGARRFSVAA